MSIKTINRVIGWFAIVANLFIIMFTVKAIYIEETNHTIFFNDPKNVIIFASALTSFVFTLISASRFLQGIEKVRIFIRCSDHWFLVLRLYHFIYIFRTITK